MNFKLEEIHGVAGLLALQSEWQELFRASEAAPFLSWEWMSAWQRWLGPQLTPRILCVRAGQQLMGLLALGEETTGLAGFKLKRLSLLGAKLGGADYLGVLARPGYESAVALTICEYLAAQRCADLLEFEELADNDATRFALEQTFGSQRRINYQQLPRYTCPQIELNADWPTVLKRSRRAENFKRRLRQLSAMSGFDYRVVTAPGEVEAAFARFLHLHEAHWKEAGGSEATGHETLVNFHRDVVAQMAQAGWLRFEEMWCEGKCRATIYGLATGGGFYYFNAGYDQDWSRLSVGLVLLGLSIRDAISREVKVYDFLRGTENYKADWATMTRATVAIQIARQQWPTALPLAVRAAQREIKAFAQSHLPSHWQQSLRALKRQYLLGK